MSAELRRRVMELAGLFPVLAMLVMIAGFYSHSATAAMLAGALALAGIIAFALADRSAPVIFVLVGLAMVSVAALTQPDWWGGTWNAVERGSFVMALYTALSAIRIAAMGSEEILECGRFLAGQRPGLRYIALSIGGHLFGLILMYGSIALLGGLSKASTMRETDPELRRHRLRRMLVAINRGFAATLCWSPLGFSMAITLALVPGASWNNVVLPCAVNALLLIGLGWGLDTLFKPRLSHPAPPRAAPSGKWLRHLRPLLLLLAAIVTGVVLLHNLVGVDVVAAVMTCVPAIAVAWICLQGSLVVGGARRHLSTQVSHFVRRELPSCGNQIVLLFMAAFIGSLGAFMLEPVLPRLGLDLSVLPGWLIVVAMVWLVPLTGQLGMNPILSVSMILPILPAPEVMGVPPAALVAAVTGGWAISGTTSPFTASVMLLGGFAGLPARQLGLRWNGPYALCMGCAISAWVLILIWLI
ncbi:hypothetical protein [Paracoccus seriniphilus]|uniref:hypothetical protein n=1 Tax=Paracoccus seriniphilus TaxID=184748 RepID=UPI000B76EC1F|nr:hypothetical protein [Paracoccus seriniphilus]WCR15684.1 hypothetical protein JHW44_14320 [Paracoccus seriniphilus]